MVIHNNYNITPEKALEKIDKIVKPIGIEYVKLEDASHRVLAADIKVLYDLPPFSQSAMDGYALCSKDTKEASETTPIKLRIIGELQAKLYKTLPALAKNEAVKIYTGAPLPKNADTVIIQEEAVVHNNTLIVNRKLPPYENVRKKGEEIRAGRILVKKGTLLNSGILAIIGTQGYNKIAVFKKPRISLIITGSEIVKVGRKLKFGEIYDTNSIFLTTFLTAQGFKLTYYATVDDNFLSLKSAFQQAVKNSDLIITTGGVSVGKRDLVKEVAQSCGFKEVFWRIAQKPGGPIYFAVKHQTYLIGLPGNPAATIICSYLYVLYLLRKIESCSSYPKFWFGILKENVTPHISKTLLLRCDINYDKKGNIILLPLPKQASHMITNLIDTKAIAKIAPAKDILPSGTKVPFLYIPS